MSGFIGSASGGTAGPFPFTKEDKRLLSSFYQPKVHHQVDFCSEWWPRSSLDASGGEMITAQSWGQPDINSGAVSKLAFPGVTRDAYGSILPSCTVKLFKTADGNFPDTKDRIIDTATSDAVSGAYTLLTPYAEAHYITATKAGAPDVQGMSVNTLVGA